MSDTPGQQPDDDARRDLDRMRPPREARAIIDGTLRPLGRELVPLREALGRALVDDLIAPEDFPPFPASTMDGFAVLAADHSPWREIIGEGHAGAVLDVEVTEGYTTRIMTGAPLPPGADAVVPVEATELADDHVVIHQEDVQAGANVRPVGSDLPRGTLVLPQGTVLGAPEIGLVASMGVNPVPVGQLPRVSVLSTGDELVEPGDPLEPGQIRDANRFSLAGALAAEPCVVSFSGKAPDDREALESFLGERMTEDDVIVTSGGVSMGERDLIKAILFESPEITVHFRRLFLKPGKPLNFATGNDTWIFGLPGNPVSSLVTLELFIRPAIRRLAGYGAAEIDRPRIRVTLEHGTPGADRIEYQRGIVTAGPDGLLTGRNTGGQQSSRLASFIGSNALLVIPPREHRYEAGEVVEAIMLGAPYSASPN